MSFLGISGWGCIIFIVLGVGNVSAQGREFMQTYTPNLYLAWLIMCGVMILNTIRVYYTNISSAKKVESVLCTVSMCIAVPAAFIILPDPELIKLLKAP